jgi:hypothetical protein
MLEDRCLPSSISGYITNQYGRPAYDVRVDLEPLPLLKSRWDNRNKSVNLAYPTTDEQDVMDLEFVSQSASFR